jgi:GNAT superfamily N-acetyltransferase
MTETAVELSSHVPSEDRAAVLKGLVDYNAQHGYPWPWLDLDFVLRDATGRVVGGALAETNARWCFIKGLWVAEGLRRGGHGSRLLAAVEDGARARNCIGVYLDTYSFQARPFYERHGYTVFGVLPDMPPGGAKYYLFKRLDTAFTPAPSEP